MKTIEDIISRAKADVSDSILEAYDLGQREGSVITKFEPGEEAYMFMWNKVLKVNIMNIDINICKTYLGIKSNIKYEVDYGDKTLSLKNVSENKLFRTKEELLKTL